MSALDDAQAIAEDMRAATSANARDDIDAIVYRARTAFFDVVMASLPAGTPGDLDPLTLSAFDDATREAVRALVYNAIAQGHVEV